MAMNLLDRLARAIVRKAVPPLFPARGMATTESRVEAAVAMHANAHTRPVGDSQVHMFIVDIDRVDDPETEVR